MRRKMATTLAVVVTLAACSGGDDSGIDQTPATDIGQEGVGTCLLFGDEVGAEVTELPVIACNDQHSHEIYAVVTSGEPLYPGFDALEETALAECLGAFEPYVGISPFDSDLIYSWLVPTLNSWGQEDDDPKGDRETLCVVANLNGGSLTGSVRGTRL
jgi:hypothetical protein